jgi:hypothetical protein
VCAAVVAVQVVVTVVAYGALLRGLVERPLLRLWEDLAPGAAGACAVVAVAAPSTWALAHAGLPAPLTLLLVGVAGAGAGAAALRRASQPTWEDLSRLAGRVLTGRGRRPQASDVPLVEATSS